ncbi:4'-phosphopantetheinyl transferase family protein [Streptomyces sp. NPDC088354]|uniref:4'-phosphopantetheinyl transferase family protein n=1 Tax=unclassified Streptomyces TaxID=2593676 RepID=UPI0029A6F3F8|nr:4'-phosphopantetheinyl transferase superfamily protein [Streptomyces sp. MI02-7b]MDX3073276.1 4'-phosphopantetheinyl transferase superfamily protein [Streptomyces sp. MI02-7b]
MTLVPRRFDPAAPPPDPAPPGPGGPPRLWLVDTAATAVAAARLAPDVLDAEERRRAAAFRFDRDRDAYVSAHVALRVLLGGYLGTAPGAVTFVRETCPTCGGPHGRPAVPAGRPHFSLSHTRGLSLLAFAAGTVGADVEEVPGGAAADGVWQSLHPREVAELEALAEPERALAFTRAWVRKEAYLKALGTGLSRELSADYLGTAPTPSPGPAGWRVHDVAAGADHMAAIAVRED